MEITYVGPGEAPDGSDRVTIVLRPNGEAGFSGERSTGEVVQHFASGENSASLGDALESSKWWAADANVEHLFVEMPADADLLRAYQRTNGEPGNPEADALLAEIERRGLDI